MSGFSTGVNAVRTAAQLIDMAGDNIANANTPGYHLKRADISPVIGPTIGGIRIGLGSRVDDIQRVRNELIERALLQHVQAKELFGTELETLQHLELLFGEPSDAGLNARLGEFFDSIEMLAADPDDTTLREQVVQKADAVCQMFKRLDMGLRQVLDDLWNKIDYTVGRINALSERIAALNGQIRDIETGGTTAPGLKDTRDGLVSELAELINITTYDAGNGVVNVSCAGTVLVNGNHHLRIEAEPIDEGVVIQAEDSIGHRMRVRQGQLGGLLELYNEIVPDYAARLDELANTFRREVNLVHTTALGLSGRFTQLDGLNAFPTDDPFSDCGYDVAAGTSETLVINVEDTATGELTQYELTLDTTQAADAFLIALRDDINASVDHVTASVSGGRINLLSDDGYAFGFATPYDPNPAEAGDITAAAPTSPSILDAYTGTEDLVYEVTFLNGGEVGTDTIDIQIDVRDPSGPLLRTLTRTIDADYAPGNIIHLENGLRLTLSEGDVVAGDGFSFTAYAEMDSAGVLDALGLNVLFTGLGAGGIDVAEGMAEQTDRLAGALRPMTGDNHRFMDLAAVRSAHVASSGTATLNGFYHALVSHIGTTRNTRSVQHKNQEELVKDLQNRRDAVSGVSVDEEMIKMIEARTIHQGALKYISLLDQSLADLLNVL